MLLIAAIAIPAIAISSKNQTINTLSKNQSHPSSLGKYFGIDDPVEQKIKELKAQGMNDSDIVENLKAQGMFWDPKTDDHGVGVLLTPEESAKYNMGGSRAVYSGEISTSIGPLSVIGGTQANIVYKTSDSNYKGVCGNMKPGSLAISQTGTSNHCITSHVGGPNTATDDWIEVGIRRDINVNGQPLGPYTVFTYWGHGGTAAWYCPPGFSVGPDTTIAYQIVIGSYDSSHNAYPYDVYVNGQFVRRVYINRETACVDWANEVWRPNESVSYTSDISNAEISSTWLINSNYNWVAWNHNIADNEFWAPYFGFPMTGGRYEEGSNPIFWRFWSHTT
jgi:hypothetical protein